MRADVYLNESFIIWILPPVICVLRELQGKSVTKSIADRVALLTYGVINMSMVSGENFVYLPM